MTIQELGKNARIQEWANMIQACKSSGKSVKRWCKENGVNIKTYYERHKKVCAAMGDQFSMADLQGIVNRSSDLERSQPAVQQWLPVTIRTDTKEVAQPQEQRHEITVRLNNCTIRAEEGTDAQWLAAVIKALNAEC